MYFVYDFYNNNNNNNNKNNTQIDGRTKIDRYLAYLQLSEQIFSCKYIIQKHHYCTISSFMSVSFSARGIVLL